VLAGGPRGGSGDAVAEASRAEGMDRVAYSRAGGLPVQSKDTSCGGAELIVHSGQSMDLTPMSLASPSTCAMNLMEVPLQIISYFTGLTMGAATAMPSEKTNHTSTSRGRNVKARSGCMAVIMLYLISSARVNEQAVVHTSPQKTYTHVVGALVECDLNLRILL
jgi:hypothetical protein